MSKSQERDMVESTIINQSHSTIFLTEQNTRKGCESVDSIEKSSAGIIFQTLLPSSLPGELLKDTRKNNGLCLRH